MWWFFFPQGAAVYLILWYELSWAQESFGNNLGQKSSLPSPPPHPATGGLSLSRSGKTWASTWCSPWSPPTALPLWFHVFILWFYLSFSSDSGLILYLSLSRFLSEYHPYCYAFFLTSDVHNHRLCLKFNISLLWRVTYLAGVFVDLDMIVCLSLWDCKAGSGSVKK